MGAGRRSGGLWDGVGGAAAVRLDGRVGRHPGRLRDDRLRARIDWPGYAPNRTRWKAQEEALFAVERPWVHADAIIDNGPSPNCRCPECRMSGMGQTRVRPEAG